MTSALVGLFYLADEYIALGNAAEDYLIVPNRCGSTTGSFQTFLATGLDVD